MSTKFFSATHKTNEALDVLDWYDTDFPLSFFLAVNAVEPLTSGNWEINIHNYKGDVIEENIDWTKVYMELTMGDVLSFLAPSTN